MGRYSKAAEKAIGNKMHKMRNEKRPQKQKVAIAMSEARRAGLKVPPPPKRAARSKKSKAKK